MYLQVVPVSVEYLLSTMSRVTPIILFLSFVVIIELVTSNVIDNGKISETDIKDHDEPNNAMTEDKDAKIEEVTTNQAPVSPSKECVKVGQYCNFHTDCCTNSCLGYMKRCV